MPLAETADLVLPIAFALLGLTMIAGVVLTVIKDVGLTTKSLVTALALLLVLPLLWAPVLAVVVTAAIAGASVEYSSAYADFRIAVSHLIYPLVALLGEDPAAAVRVQPRLHALRAGLGGRRCQAGQGQHDRQPGREPRTSPQNRNRPAHRSPSMTLTPAGRAYRQDAEWKSPSHRRQTPRSLERAAAAAAR